MADISKSAESIKVFNNRCFFVNEAGAPIAHAGIVEKNEKGHEIRRRPRTPTSQDKSDSDSSS